MIEFMLILLICRQFITAKYHINNSHDSSYLYREINIVKEINNEIKLKITVNKMEGTLLYMFDKYGNQLIISLSSDLEERMKIEFRGEEYHLTLSELCGCMKCKYRLIQLTVRITNRIHIQCNDQPHITFIYSHRILINKAYPIIRTVRKFQVAIWLVNTPVHGEYYPNPAQLGGCIHEVSFNGKILKMNIFGSAISTKCPIACSNNVCNTGVCYETYRTEPFCDCTDSFLNGPFCNSTEAHGTYRNMRYPPKTFRFQFIKISWWNNSGDILRIGNRNTSINVQYKRNHIYLLYHDIMDAFSINKTITDKCQPNQKYRLYLSFYANIVNIKFVQNNTTFITKLFVSKDLSKEDFTSISKLSTPGFIDIVHKLWASQYHWMPFHQIFFVNRTDYVNPRNIKLERVGDINNSGSNVKSVVIGIETLFLLIFMILAVCFYIKIKKLPAVMKLLPIRSDDYSQTNSKNYEFKSLK